MKKKSVSLNAKPFDALICKKQLKACADAGKILLHENDQLKDILEMVVDHLSPFTVGDQWTQEDMIVIMEAKERYEEL